MPVMLHAQTFEWAKTGHASINASGECLVAEPDGSLLLGGTFFNNIDLDTEQLFSSGRDIFLARMNTQGKRIWAKRYGGSADDFLFDLKSDKSGDIYITGAYAYRMTMGTSTLESNGQQDAFVAKLAPNGDPLWVRSSGGYNSDFGVAVAVDAKGNVYNAGYFHDTMSFGAIKITGWNAGLMTMYLAKYDKDGKCLWAKPLGSSSYQSQFEGVSLAIDASGNVVVAGNFHGDAHLDTAAITAKGVADLFVAKFTPSGSLLWKQTAGGPTGAVNARSVALGKGGRILICGYITNNAQFDKTTIIQSPLGFSDVFLASYSAKGQFEWVKQGTGHGPKVGVSVATDEEGNSYITGDFKDTLDFGGVKLSGEGKQIFYAASYSPTGTLRWAREAGRGGFVFAKAITVDKQGSVYVTGTYNDTIGFGKHVVIGAIAAQDMFLTKIAPHSLWSMHRASEAPAQTEEITACTVDKRSHSMNVTFTVNGSHYAKLGLFDMLGETVETYTEEQLSSGTYEVKIDLANVETGAYYLRLRLDDDKSTKRIEY